MISNKMKSKRYVGLLYIAPWLLGFLIFQLYPFIASFCYSFTDYTLLNQPQFVGLKNYLTLFTTDKQFLSTMKITGFYALLSVPLKLAFALFIAILLNAKIKESAFTAACITCRPFWAEAWPCPCSGG